MELAHCGRFAKRRVASLLDMARESLPLSRGPARLLKRAQVLNYDDSRRYQVPSSVSAPLPWEKTMRRILTVCLFFATSVGAQTMYKCQVNGKIEYSGTPCSNGGEQLKKIAPGGGPTAEDRGRAMIRFQAEQARMDAKEQQERNDQRVRHLEQREDAHRAEQARVAEEAAASRATRTTESRGQGPGRSGQEDRAVRHESKWQNVCARAADAEPGTLGCDQPARSGYA